MICKVTGIFELLFVTGCFGLMCEHYCTTYDKENDSNYVAQCQLQNRTCENPSHTKCTATWRNESGKVIVANKGCGPEGLILTADRNKCIGKHSHKYNKLTTISCSCHTDLCNVKLFGPLSDEITTTVSNINIEREITEKNTENMSPVVLLILVTILPIVCVSIFVVLGFWCYMKRKHSHDCEKFTSQELPLSDQKTSSAGTSLLPRLDVCQPGLKLPQLIDMRARGRFGSVWKAQLHNHIVAVKIFAAHDKQSWQNEQDIFGTELVSGHPNILRFICAAVREEGQQTNLWLVTEYHENGSLADYLKANTVSLHDALHIIKTMATGLSFLHEDVVCRTTGSGYKPSIAHRDFKSKNVLITKQKAAIIADFGLAVKFMPGENMGDNHGQVGTRRYMAPEILEGAIHFQRDAFLRIDIYAFALVAWEVVTRCHNAPDGASSTYRMPYEEEVGQHPTLEEMQECVVDKNIRPNIKTAWKQHPVIATLCETIEDCWDREVEARLSAGCVAERSHKLCDNFISSDDLQFQSNHLGGDVITNLAPHDPSSADTEVQNKINNQMNEVAYSKKSADEVDGLLNSDSNSFPEVQISSRSDSIVIPSCEQESHI